MLRIFSVFMASFVLVFPPQNVSGEEPGFLIFGAGVYDMFDDKTTGEFRLEYVFPDTDKVGLFAPFIGLSATVEGATYGYAGIGLDLYFGDKAILTPNFAAGIYGNGDGKDLGHAIEFRSGFNLMWPLHDNSRVGLSFHHVSNAGLDERNPGEESLLFIYSIPIQDLFVK
ncbi:MAG: acyloxyacyl hydrolase [Thalassobaculaceae bacterium]